MHGDLPSDWLYRTALEFKRINGYHNRVLNTLPYLHHSSDWREIREGTAFNKPHLKIVVFQLFSRYFFFFAFREQA
jgi:hypothetical protein